MQRWAYLALTSASTARTTAIETYFADTLVELFEPGNVDDLVRCIRLLYFDQDRMQQLTEGCRKFNQQYNWTVIGAKYVDLVDRLGDRGIRGET